MTQLFKVTAAVVLCASIAGSFFALPGVAQVATDQDLSTEKIGYIKTHCVAAQTSMQRLQHSDIVTRTNRGRSYENVLRLMAALNSRVALNKMNQPRMLEIAGELQAKFNSFYGHYTDYEINIERNLKTNCVDQPVSFYQQLVDVRDKRAQLKKDVDDMNQLITEYDQSVANLQASLSKQPSVDSQ